MKRLLMYMFGVLLFFSVNPLASIGQDDTNPINEFGSFDVSNPLDKNSSLGALLGYTDIGGEGFVGMRLQPEFVLGKLAFGLDVPILFSTDDWKLRTEEYKDGIGWLRMVRYVSWGVKKRDPFYIRVGDLSGSYIGYGILLDNYSNSISFEKRKLGATFDILVGNLVGIEGLYSDFDMSSFNLMAIRPYIKPFGRTSIPIVKTIDFGFTYVTDHDETKIKLTDSTDYQNEYIKDGMKGWALDMGVMPVNMSFMQLRLYAQYGNLLKNKSQLLQDSINSYVSQPGISSVDSSMMVNYDGSHGFGIGIDFKFKAGGDALRVDLKIERLWYEKYFMPQFFNAGYEYNKDAKLFALSQTDGKKGIYGALAITAMEKVRIGGSLMIPDNVSEIAPAVVTLDLDASKLMEKVIIQGQYIKGGLIGLEDAFKLDDRSLMNIRVAYRMYKFLIVGMDYKWTWSRVTAEDGSLKFKATNYMSPYIGFSMPLNIGNQNKAIDFNSDN